MMDYLWREDGNGTGFLHSVAGAGLPGRGGVDSRRGHYGEP